MDRIVMTDLAKSYFDCLNPSDHLPLIKGGNLRTINQNTAPVLKHSHSSFSVLELRQLLRNESVNELNKIREQSQKRNYIKVKEQLLKDISNGKQFLQNKAEQIAKKIISQKQKCDSLNVGIEISKGKNYLNKIIKDFQGMEQQKLRINGVIRQRLKAQQL